MHTEIIKGVDGRPRLNYITDKTHCVVATGPARGVIQLNDGTYYDLTPDFIELDKPEHLEAVHHHIETYHEREGTFGPDFRHQHEDRTVPPAQKA